MTEFSTLLQQGNAWLFVPSAILLGALHGLEPGHSKTMMAAFIVAIRGTVTQAVLLGLSATISHTAVVWAVAMAGLYFGRNWNAEVTEAYFQVASGVLIVGVAVWMMWRTWRQQHAEHAHEHDEHDHHHDESKRIDTGHGVVRLDVFEEGVPPRFRLFRESRHGHLWTAAQVSVETERADGSRQRFSFVQRDGFVESEQEIPEPHEFVARLRLGDEHHSHDYDVEYVEHAHHHHAIKDYEGLDVSAPGYQDPHELAHANDIRRLVECAGALSRGVAQPGSASALGAEGREFESHRPDQLTGSRQCNCCKCALQDAVPAGGSSCQARKRRTRARSSTG
jgi:nickel/cobalt exporter